MVIDQRNAGASVTPTVNGTYTLDRWVSYLSQSSKFSVIQSTTVPTGFKNSLLVTSLSAYTVGSGEVFGITQLIEGLNVPDLGWGAVGATTVTLSFWVRSSLTGTFGGAIKNSAEDRAYPFSYTISTANTFEQKTITIAGDTSGTWLTTNGIGMKVVFGLGVGSTLSGTAGAWAAGNLFSATGATSVVGTNGATFYITGVQLEAGTTASPFEYRQYGTELGLCQRYFEKSFAQGTAPTEGIDNNFQTGGVGYAGNGLYIPNVGFKVTKRTTATVTIYRPNVVATNGNFAVYNATTGAWNSSTTTVNSANDTTFSVNLSSNITQDKGYAILGAWTASAEL
jgi:hypothetical protein